MAADQSPSWGSVSRFNTISFLLLFLFLVSLRHTFFESVGGRLLVLTPASFRKVENQSVMKINLGHYDQLGLEAGGWRLHTGHTGEAVPVW